MEEENTLRTMEGKKCSIFLVLEILGWTQGNRFSSFLPAISSHALHSIDQHSFQQTSELHDHVTKTECKAGLVQWKQNFFSFIYHWLVLCSPKFVVSFCLTVRYGQKTFALLLSLLVTHSLPFSILNLCSVLQNWCLNISTIQVQKSLKNKFEKQKVFENNYYSSKNCTENYLDEF